MINGPKTLEALDIRLRTLLPEEYQNSYESMEPVPMRSAGLKFAADGSVAWNEIWGSFCDLAMAGGPPHKGTLLQPGTSAEIEARPHQYDDVVAEIGRGITMATELPADASPNPGWVRVTCYGETMAGWLLRAIVMENVAARIFGKALDLPASPAFRLEKEIKNVVTVVAKTSHYWLGHMPRTQRRSIELLFAHMAQEAPLIEPAPAAELSADRTGDVVADRLSAGIASETGLVAASRAYPGWLGITCPSVRVAIWLMRAMIAFNVLSRRQETTLFVPINPSTDPDGARVLSAVLQAHRLAGQRGVV